MPTPTANPPGYVPPNPDAGLTDTQKDAHYKAATKTWEERLTEWSNCLDLRGIDLRAIHQGVSTADFVAAEPTLRLAVARAEAVVITTITAVRPTALSGTMTTASVEQTLKGPKASNLEIHQFWHLLPANPDNTGIQMVVGGDNPALLPGDRAMLFLQKQSNGGYYLEVGGAFPIVAGVVRASGYPDWQRSANGENEHDFMELVKAATH